MTKNRLLKILVPVLLVLAVAAVWLFKNQPWVSKAEETSSVNPDFALEAQSIDLERLTSYGLPIIIDFGADWCSPCKSFAPVYEDVHDEMLEKAILKYVDIDKSSAVASSYPVEVIPTQVFILSDGSPYQPSDKIDIEFQYYQDKSTGSLKYTIHQGALTADELRAVLTDMGAAQ